ncbi:hypothetical protein BKA81DRAFT_380317 [Phyllosticta paracitricarpa]|uniref:Uncharacterized protein n=1 Tax=Phyllosticta paracitricarpa TaxID=2016321 RepID=A0ABR1MYQ5_9PEZI
MDNSRHDMAPTTPRQQDLHAPTHPSFSLTPVSEDDNNFNVANESDDDSKRNAASNPNGSPYTPPILNSEAPPTAVSTQAFVQACTSHLFTVTREVSDFWPRLFSTSSSYSPALSFTVITNNPNNNNNNQENQHNTNTTTILTLIQTCQHLHFEAVELLKAVLRAEGDGALDLFVPLSKASGCAALEADGEAEAEAEALRFRLGRRVLWLLARWRQVKWSFGIQLQGDGGGGGGVGGDGQHYDDERHDSGAEM